MMMHEPPYQDETVHPWEETVRLLARAYDYPPTPDIAAAAPRLSGPPAARRPAWQRPALVFAALLLLLALALSVPAVRAAVRDWLQIGAVRIVLTPPATMPAVTVTAPSLPGEPLSRVEAEAVAGFALRLPTAPPAGAPPDRFYLQRLPLEPEASVVISVWDDPERPGEPLLTLYQIASDNCCLKGAWGIGGAETTVGGQQAYWVEQEHPLQLGQSEGWLLVPDAVLVWTDGVFTYRLESSLTVEAAVRVAESIQ